MGDAGGVGGVDGPDAPAPDDEGGRAQPRQRVERVRGGRRAKLTPAPGSDPSPEAPEHREDPAKGPASPDDERITRERPPHW